MLSVDVVIPTYKPEETFDRLMEQLSHQTVSPARVIVMNTEESCFHMPDTIPAHTEIHHIKKKEFDHGGTRNRGFCYGSSDLVLFLTQDAVPADSFLIEKIMAPFSDPLVGACYARQLADEASGAIEQYTRLFNYPEESSVKTKEDLKSLGIKTYFCSNVCAVYRRDVLEELQGFPEPAIFNEDMIFAAKVIAAGYKIVYNADAKVIHSHRLSGMEQFHRNFDLAVSQVRHPEVFADLRSEDEGVRLVLDTAKWLLSSGKWYLLFKLFYQSGCKYMGYLLGKRVDKLPKKLVLWATMNREYWEKGEDSYGNTGSH